MPYVTYICINGRRKDDMVREPYAKLQSVKLSALSLGRGEGRSWYMMDFHPSEGS